MTLLTGCEPSPPAKPRARPAATVPATVHETAHYRIHSSATKNQTAVVAAAVEALYESYASLLPVTPAGAKFQLVLYQDRAEFKRNNRSSPWAEAYYWRPRSFAYAAEGGNSSHWMLHEVTHQLLAEASGYRLQRWLNEGLATYFGSSQWSDGRLQLGTPDPGAYPLWWLSAIESSLGQAPTFEGKPLISLQQLVTGTGPPIAAHVNNYYVCYWSLTHYLFHGDEKRHRNAVITLLSTGGDAASFVQLVGRFEDIEPRWHAHLTELSNRYNRR